MVLLRVLDHKTRPSLFDMVQANSWKAQGLLGEALYAPPGFSRWPWCGQGPGNLVAEESPPSQHHQGENNLGKGMGE